MAADPYRIHRGAILEEVVLYILSQNGYLPVTSDNDDDSLVVDKGALRVKGRGSQHQIDAIADARYSPPFCHQQRLLIEAKFLGQKVGLDVIRNATGVIKDVSEFWVPVDGAKDLKRYHYMYGVFSKSEFSKPSQEYAFAHDVYLLPLERNRFFRSIVKAIESFGDSEIDDQQGSIAPKPSVVRAYLRQELLLTETLDQPELSSLRSEDIDALYNIIETVKGRTFGYMTTLGGSFPVFLMAENKIDELDLEAVTQVQIYYDHSGWEIRNEANNKTLFTFDLPDELFNLYAESGNLSAEKAIQMKNEKMADFDVLLYSENKVEVKKFILSKNWIDKVKNNLALENL